MSLEKMPTFRGPQGRPASPEDPGSSPYKPRARRGRKPKMQAGGAMAPGARKNLNPAGVAQMMAQQRNAAKQAKGGSRRLFAAGAKQAKQASQYAARAARSR